jgi:hypothetical protein
VGISGGFFIGRETGVTGAELKQLRDDLAEAIGRPPEC